MKNLVLFTFSLFIGMSVFAQDCTDLFISEYVEGSGNNKAIELYNPTNSSISLDDYKLVRYSNGGTAPYSVALAGSIQAKSTYVVVVDKRDPLGIGYEEPVDSALLMIADTFLCPIYEVNKMMYFNGNDAVTLEKNNIASTVVDLFGLVGPPMTSDDNGWGSLNDTTITYMSGGNPTEYTIQNYIVGPLFWLSWTKNHTLIRKTHIGEGVKENPIPYFVVYEEWDSIPVNTFDSLGFHNCDCSTFDIRENIIQPEVSIYPNPVINGELTIETDEAIEDVKIIDITGKVVDFIQTETQNGSVKLKMVESHAGFYFVNVRFSSTHSITKKILVL